jgi:hypothetical protein
VNAHLIIPRSITGCLLAAATCALISCQRPERVEITQSRPRHSMEPAPRLDVSLADSLPSPQQYRWSLPPGWTEKPATAFREANFAFGPGGEGECYLSRTQGSELENINRWRQQMGETPITEADLAGLPRKTIFGVPAVFLDLTGTYSGAGGAAPEAGTRMLGLVRAERDLTLTVKMTGPADLVGEHTANFDSFVASLRLTPSYNP